MKRRWRRNIKHLSFQNKSWSSHLSEVVWEELWAPTWTWCYWRSYWRGEVKGHHCLYVTCLSEYFMCTSTSAAAGSPQTCSCFQAGGSTHFLFETPACHQVTCLMRSCVWWVWIMQCSQVAAVLPLPAGPCRTGLGGSDRVRLCPGGGGGGLFFRVELPPPAAQLPPPPLV